MLRHPTLAALEALKLTGMATALMEQLEMPEVQRLSFEERLGLLVDREGACGYRYGLSERKAARQAGAGEGRSTGQGGARVRLRTAADSRARTLICVKSIGSVSRTGSRCRLTNLTGISSVGFAALRCQLTERQR